MDATAKLEVQPGVNHADHDKSLHEGMQTNLDALSLTYGTEINQTQSKPAGAHEISLEQLRENAHRPVRPQRSISEWWKAITSGGSEDDLSSNFGIVRDKKALELAERPAQEEQNGSNDNS